MAGDSGTSLDALASIIKLFAGSKQTTSQEGGTTVKNEGISQDALNAMLKSALESNQGLASVMGAEKSAGLYNSSTNSLLSNDLVTRLAAQAAMNNRTTTVVNPATKTTVANPGVVGGKGTAAAVAAGTLLKNASAAKNLYGLGKKGYDKLATSAASAAGSDSYIPISTIEAANASNDPIGALQSATNNFAFADVPAGSTFEGSPLEVAGLGGDDFQTLAPTDWLSGADGLATYDGSALDAAGGFQTTDTQTLAPAGWADSAPAAEESANFMTASPTAGTASSLGSASEAAPSAGEAIISSATYSPDLTSATAEEVEAMNSAASVGSDVEALEAADGAGTASSGVGTGGTTLGYAAAAYKALNAPDNTYGKDYRSAVGTGVLNYFGFGWAAPFVDHAALETSDKLLETGNEYNGVNGSVASEPVGAMISGEFKQEDLATSVLDPADLFGGNPGGSIGGAVGQAIDPGGATIGGENSIAGILSDSVNNGDFDHGADPIANNVIDNIIGGGGGGGGGGKVVCTELAYQDKLDIGLYRLSISQELAMSPQVLRGYHVVGVPLVRVLRKSPWWSAKITPYVAAYIKHKAGQKSFRGFAVKCILHSVSWILGLFNKDQNYYKTLYPYRRAR